MTAFCFQGAEKGGVRSGCFLRPDVRTATRVWECAGGSGERVGGGEADVAHALEDFGVGAVRQMSQCSFAG